MVLCDSHVPSGGLVRDGKLLLDFHSFPLRVMETPDKPQEAVLKVGFSDGIYGRSKGGLSPTAGSATICRTWWNSITGARAGHRVRRKPGASGSGGMMR